MANFMIIGAKPFPLVSLVANPFTGNVDMVLSEEAIALYGPIYPSIVRQQLEKALKVAEGMERSVQFKQCDADIDRGETKGLNDRV